MKLYKITQSDNNGYDTYDSAIVCANSEDEARIINPGGYYKYHDNDWYFQYADGTERLSIDGTWTHPSKVTVELIGNAKKGLESGIILSSFNAG